MTSREISFVTYHKNRPNMRCVIDSTLNTAYTPAREGRTAQEGPAESDNPKSEDCIPRHLVVQHQIGVSTKR